MSTLEHLRPEGLPHPPTYSQVVVASGKRTVYAAGQIAVDASGALVGGNDLGAQTTQAMRNLGLALAAAGASYADIVKLTTYVVNYKPENRATIGAARSAFFTNGNPPASTLVGVSALAMPEWLIEIEAVAVLD
jgi:enamine deaminase RidA (YjgF/YER057c/UK114 family)